MRYLLFLHIVSLPLGQVDISLNLVGVPDPIDFFMMILPMNLHLNDLLFLLAFDACLDFALLCFSYHDPGFVDEVQHASPMIMLAVVAQVVYAP